MDCLKKKAFALLIQCLYQSHVLILLMRGTKDACKNGLYGLTIFDLSQLIMLRNLLSSAKAVSIEVMSPIAMLLIPAGTEARVTELRGVVRREEL